MAQRTPVRRNTKSTSKAKPTGKTTSRPERKAAAKAAPKAASKATSMLKAMAKHSPVLALVNIELRHEYAAVLAEEWDGGASAPRFGSVMATEDDLKDRSCYSVGTATSSRDTMTQIGRKTADDCRQPGVTKAFVLVKMEVFRRAGG